MEIIVTNGFDTGGEVCFFKEFIEKMFNKTFMVKGDGSRLIFVEMDKDKRGDEQVFDEFMADMKQPQEDG